MTAPVADLAALVSIMDLVMFDAQRQGRVSFYMVRKARAIL